MRGFVTLKKFKQAPLRWLSLSQGWVLVASVFVLQSHLHQAEAAILSHGNVFVMSPLRYFIGPLVRLGSSSIV